MCISNLLTKGGLKHVAAHTTVVWQTNGRKIHNVPKLRTGISMTDGVTAFSMGSKQWKERIQFWIQHSVCRKRNMQTFKFN